MQHKFIKSSLIGLSLITSVSFATSSMAASSVVGIPFAVINMMQLSSKSTASLNAAKALKALQTTNLNKIKALKASSSKQANALRKKASTSTPAETVKIRKQMSAIGVAYNKKVDLYRRQIAYSQNIYNQELMMAIHKESETLRVKYQLAAIFNTSSLSSVAKNLDLTAEALKDLNKSVKKLKAPNLSKVK